MTFRERPEIDRKLIIKGVMNLKEFGYPSVNVENIMTDSVFAPFFMGMLKDNKGLRADIDEAIDRLSVQIKEAVE